MLTSQDQPQIEHYCREKDGTWTYQCHRGIKAIVKIASIRCTLKAKDVYRRVPLKKDSNGKAA